MSFRKTRYVKVKCEFTIAMEKPQDGLYGFRRDLFKGGASEVMVACLTALVSEENKSGKGAMGDLLVLPGGRLSIGLAYPKALMALEQPEKPSKQLDKAEKHVATEGDYTKLAKDLERSEPGKRAQHYQKGRKKNLSRARRRVDKELTRG